MIANVDDRVRAQEQLDEARMLLETVFDNIPAELYLRELDGAFVMMNEWGARFYNSDKEGMKGRLASEFDTGEEIEIARQAQEQLLATGLPVVQQYNYTVGGRDLVVSNTMFPVRDAEGRITRIGGFTIDVTELHKARKDLQRAQATLRSFVDQSPVGIYINRLGPRGIEDQIVEFSNDRICQPYGLTSADFIGRNPFEVIRDDAFVSAGLESDALILSTRRPIQYERLNPYSGRHESYTRFPIMDPSGQVTHIAGMRVDVDERVRAERQLDEVKALLQTIFDNVPAELYLRRLDGQYLMANTWALDFYGLTEADLPHLTAETFDTGEGIEVSRQAQRELLETGRPVTREYHHKARGRDVVILNTIFPLRNAVGEIDRIGGVSTDITELYAARTQLQRAQDSLHQSEKLAALGQLLAGIAHELNNPLAVVLGRAAILQEKLAGTPHEVPLQKLRDAANRCARIVKTFLAMARQTGPRRQLVEINHLIEAALEMTTYGLRTSGIIWQAHPLAQSEEIEVDQDQIVQVLINLILNAQHALEDVTGPRRIDIAVDLTGDRRWLSIAVADNGPGVPDTIAGRIFDPFFTTKGVGKGTGLGLSVCKSMVEAHGGILALEKTPGGGATFRMTLPVTQGQDLDAGDNEQAAATPTMKGRILVVDDEVEIAAILVDCLAPLGLDCVIAADGRAALERVAENAFDAVFCDVSMPEMDGITFYHHLRQSNPILASRLVFISGDVLHRDWDKYRATVDRPIIEKPFDPRQVRDVALQLLAPEGDA
jgi:PAS domain S-box-containing protein